MDQRHLQHGTRNNARRIRNEAVRQVAANNGNSHEFLDDEEYDDVWPPRLPNSVRRYQSDVRMETGRTRADVQVTSSREPESVSHRNSIPSRRTATRGDTVSVQSSRQRAVDTDDYSRGQNGESSMARRSPRLHWLVFVGFGLIVMIIGWMLLSMLMSWWQVTQNDWLYGRPRTYQTDQVVGHNDSAASPSHFIALNLNRHVEVIECPGGDCSKARIFMGPVLTGPGQDLAPVTLTFKDVNGDGKLDMIVNVQGSHFVFLNGNGTFRPAGPGDNVHL